MNSQFISEKADSYINNNMNSQFISEKADSYINNNMNSQNMNSQNMSRFGFFENMFWKVNKSNDIIATDNSDTKHNNPVDVSSIDTPDNSIDDDNDSNDQMNIVLPIESVKTYKSDSIDSDNSIDDIQFTMMINDI
jgi:hypothetical protein